VISAAGQLSAVSHWHAILMQLSHADETRASCICTSHRLGYDYRARFGGCQILKRISGGTLYFASNHEGFAIIADESPLAARLGAKEMPEPISVYLFPTEQARMAHALRRGWWTERVVAR
jgi:hypothetical protein